MNNGKTYLLLTLGSILISGYAIGVAKADYLNASETSFLRLFWALVIVVLFYNFKLIKKKVAIKPLIIISILGLAGQGLNNYLGAEGIRISTHVPTFVLVVSMVPIFSYFGDLVLKRMSFSWSYFGAILVAFFGLAVVLLDPNESINISNNLLAYTFALLTSIAITIFSLFIGPYSKKYSTEFVLFVSLLVSLLFLLPINSSSINFAEVFSWQSIGWGTFFGLITLLIPEVIRIHALEKFEPTRVAIFSLIIPISTSIISYFVLDSKITTSFVIGSIICLTALYYIITKKPISIK